MHHKAIVGVLIISFAAFLGIVMSTDPTKLSSTVLLVPFLLLLVSLWSAMVLVFRATGSGRSRAVRLSIVTAGLPIGLLLLQSIGQLSTWDTITVIVFAAIAYFYVAKITTKVPD